MLSLGNPFTAKNAGPLQNFFIAEGFRFNMSRDRQRHSGEKNIKALETEILEAAAKRGMNRRAFLSTLGGGLLAAPLAAACRRPSPPLVGQIRVERPGSKSTIVWSHVNKVEPLNFADVATHAWREADGTVNLFIATFEAYRLRGRNLLSLSSQVGPKIYSAAAVGLDPVEDHYNFRPFLTAPYSDDGVNLYSLVHMEWPAACLIPGDIDIPGAYANSWVNAVTQMKSSDGGASWHLNTVDGNYVVSKPGYHWTGTLAQTSRSYLYANNMTGLHGPSNLLKEGAYYYSVCNLFQRDFSVINPLRGVYQAPITKEGLTFIRTTDFKSPNNWEAWGGSGWEPQANNNWGTWYPTYHGATMKVWGITWYYDVTANLYVLVFPGNAGMHEPVYYVTTPSLANMVWSDAVAIVGSELIVTDPLGKPADPPGSWLGFSGANYPIILDPSCPGFQFDKVLTDSPWLFYCQQPGYYNNRGPAWDPSAYRNDVYRIQLKVTYDPSQQLSLTVADTAPLASA